MCKFFTLLVCFCIMMFFGESFTLNARLLYSGPQPSSKNSANSITLETKKNAAQFFFIENRGQITDQDNNQRPDINFGLSATGGLNIFIGSGSIHYQFNACEYPIKPGSLEDLVKNGSVSRQTTNTLYRMDVELVGANKNAKVLPEQKRGFYEKYFTQNTGEKGITAYAYDRVTYRDVYPNIDWVLYVAKGKLKHEFVVKEGGKVSDIKLKYGGAKKISLDDEGNLVAVTPQGTITEHAPVTFQSDGKPISSSFILVDSVISYETAQFSGTLTIDPTLEWATYYGGSSTDEGNGVVTDGSGNVYVTGVTASISLIASSGAYQTSLGGGGDAYIAKFDSDGVRLWGTYYGGSSSDEASSIAIDGAGNIYIAGSSYSATGISTTGAYQIANGGGGDAFLAKFDGSGALQWGTYYGGGNYDYSYSVSVDAGGNVYMGGQTSSTTSIASPGAHQAAILGANDAFLVKFDNAGNRQWGTYFGGSANDFCFSVTVDGSGNVYMTGYALSLSGIATSGAFQTVPGGGTDAYLVKFNSSGVRQWGTYFGGSNAEYGYSVVTDVFENVFITGFTYSTSGVVTTGAHQTTFGGGATDAYIAKFNSLGVRQWSTYYGGNGTDLGQHLTIDGLGNVYITGYTFSSSGIATAGAYLGTYTGSQDAFLGKFNNSGELVYGTYYGGSNSESGMMLASDGVYVYLAGNTYSTSGITTSGSHQPTNGGLQDAFLAKFNLPCTVPVVAPITGSTNVCSGSSITLTNATPGGVWSSDVSSVATIDIGGVVAGVSAGYTVISYSVTNSCGTSVAKSIVTVGQPVINTIAGNGTAGFSGDGFAATAAQLQSPYGLATDVSGNFYFCDYNNNRIRKVNAGGIISTIAGTGTMGYSGDGSTATSAEMRNPTGITIDPAGNIIFTDYNNNVVRKINASGIVSTIAGTGVTGFFGDGGPATAAYLNHPTAVITDAAGNVIFSDALNHRVRKIDLAGNISTIAGTGFAGFAGDGALAIGAQLNNPYGLAIDGTGNLLIADQNNRRIRKVNASGIITTILGTGVAGSSPDGTIATAAEVNQPSGLVVDAEGNVIYTDGANNCVRRIGVISGTVTTIINTGFIAGYSGDGGPPTAAKLNNVPFVSIDQLGNMYVSDLNNNRIRAVKAFDPTVAPISGASSVCVGTTISLTDITAGGTWSSSDISVATVGSAGVLTGIASGVVDITYSVPFTCGLLFATKSITVNTLPAVPAPITGLSVVCVGANIILDDITAGGIWTSTAAGVATIGSVSGIVTGGSAGTSTISYTISNMCGSTATTAIVTVNVAPGSIMGVANLCVGETATLTAIPSGGTWTSGSPTIAGVGSSSGVVTGIVGGEAVVTYMLITGCSVTKTLTVNALPAPITPLSAVSICVGEMTSLADTSPSGTWGSSDVGIASVDGAGTVTGMAAGVVAISYTNATGCAVVKNITVNITPAPLLPASASVCIGNTMSFSESITGGMWSSSSPGIASVAAGIVTGVAAGAATISYTIGACVVTAPVTVNLTPPSITHSGSGSICAGGTILLANTSPGGTWSSSDAGVALVNSTGLVTGISTGIATISYTSAVGCLATKLVTINTTPSAISPANTTVCTGNLVTLTNSIGGGIWTSSVPSIASVSGGFVTGNSVGAATITYSIGACFATAEVTVNLSPNAGVIVGASSICVGTPVVFSDAASGGIWSSSNPIVATVSSSGVVSGVSAGSAIISYSVVNSCGTDVAVMPIVVNIPASAGTIVGLSMVCAGTYTFMVDTTPGGVWSCTNRNATISSTGLFTGITPGLDTVLYTVTNACGVASAMHIVNIGLFLTAGAISGPGSVCAGSTITLIDPVPGGVWSSSGVEAWVAGGIVTGVSGGTVTISYTVTSGCGSVSATHPVNVIPTPYGGVISGPIILCTGMTGVYSTTGTGGMWSVTNSIATITSGGIATAMSPGIDTITYTVTNACGTDVSSTTVTIGPAITAGSISGPGFVCEGAAITLTNPVSGGVWSASNANATVSSGGVVTGVSAGSVNISYTVTGSCGSVSAVAYLAVLPAANAGTIAGPSAVCIGSTISLTNSTSGGVWSASNSNATVSGGSVTGVSAGTVDISYTVTTPCGPASAVHTVTVGAIPVAGTITGPTSVCESATITLSATAPGGVWSADNANATVSSAGLVTGVTAGTDMISYTVTTACGTATGTSLITINPLPFAGAISGPVDVCIGATITLTDPVTGGVWSASNTNATVSGGMVTGISAGTVNIIYSVTNICGPAAAVSTITVHPAPDAGVITGVLSVCVGATTTLTATVSGGVWSASNTNATVAGGIVAGVTAGIDTISYTVANICGTAVTSVVVTINPVPAVTSISGPSSVCRGATITLTNATPGGMWSASNTKATISSVGAVTGVTTGTDTIIYTVTNSCGSTSVTKTITISQSPVAGSVAGPSIVCAGQTITLYSAVLGGTWGSSNPAVAAVSPAGVVSGISVGSAVISYTVSNGCGSRSATKPVTVLSIADCSHTNIYGTGITQHSLKIFPNPNNGTFVLSGTLGVTTDMEVPMEITDLLGKKIYAGILIPDDGVVDERIELKDSIASGVYLLTLHTSAGKIMFKIVVEQ